LERAGGFSTGLFLHRRSRLEAGAVNKGIPAIRQPSKRFCSGFNDLNGRLRAPDESRLYISLFLNHRSCEP
jgi:hypothetical protein